MDPNEPDARARWRAARAAARSGVPAGPADRSVASPDGAWRADLFLSGRSEATGRGVMVPTYHLVLVRTSDNRVIVDTRRTGHEVWHPDASAMDFQLSRPGQTESHIVVDMATGRCWPENFRGPIGSDEGLGELASLL